MLFTITGLDFSFSSLRSDELAADGFMALLVHYGKRVRGESLREVRCCCNEKVKGGFTVKCHRVSTSVPLDSSCEGHMSAAGGADFITARQFTIF